MTALKAAAASVPSAAAIRGLMRSGYDTIDIARLFHVSEAEIWNVLGKS